ncbi:MAG: hypothetical protein V2I56_19060 [Desulfobacteraceae bacterium]|nr:hypothetical protein [Desulfobacteraceae bacterium]
MSRPHVDPARVIEEIFYITLHRMFHNEGARSHFGFTHINAFSLSGGLPGWNLWFDGCEGAYQMSLVDADCCSSGGQDSPDWVKGRWAVHYFPAMNEKVLEGFSAIENLLRFGPMFDATGTLTPAGREQLDPAYFMVGDVDIRIALDRRFIEISGRSQDRWREMRPEGLYLGLEGEAPVEVVMPGDWDRDVPGWELTSFFYDKLVCGICQAYGSAPSFAFEGRRSARQLEIIGTRQTRSIPDPKAEGRLVCVGMPLSTEEDDPGRPTPTFEAERQRLILKGWRVSSAAETDCPGSSPFNPQWWSIRDRTFKVSHRAEAHLCCYQNH